MWFLLVFIADDNITIVGKLKKEWLYSNKNLNFY